MLFTPAVTPPDKCLKQSLYIVINGQEMIIKPVQDRYLIPTVDEISALNLDLQQAHFIGLWDGHCCYAIESSTDLAYPESLLSVPLREMFNHFSSAGIHAISLATQIITWDKNSRFCGQCGRPITKLSDERAKACENCSTTNYPRLSPSIIVSVVKDNRILLARSPHFPKEMYSVLAGFVEPGETLEECLQREVREEVGIEVGNISYFGSQNWPFPHSMMIAFTADYSQGEIRIDNKEILDAQWFTAEDLPKLPGSYSIARQLIDHFLNASLSSGKYLE